jgi:hypothetical protein
MLVFSLCTNAIEKNMGVKLDLSLPGKYRDWRCLRTRCKGEYLDIREVDTN